MHPKMSKLGKYENDRISSSSPNKGLGRENVIGREETAIPRPVYIHLKAAVVIKTMYRGFWLITGLDVLKTAVV